MSDVLVLTIPLRHGVGYPSLNHAYAGSRVGGKRSDEYKALAYDVEEAGREAVAAGWETIAHPCRAWITLYAPDRRVRDAFNLGSCEANALTRAGVWTDDELARPVMLDVQPASDGPARIVIVVQRLAPVGAARAVRGAAKKPAAPVVQMRASEAAGPVPMLNGQPISMDEARRLISGAK